MHYNTITLPAVETEKCESVPTNGEYEGADPITKFLK